MIPRPPGPLRTLRRRALATIEAFCLRRHRSALLRTLFDHTLPDLLAQRLTSEMDADIIQRVLPDQRRVRLGECPPAGILFKTIWSLAAASRIKQPILKRVDCEHEAGSFAIEVDMTKTPECGYYLYDLNPKLTAFLQQAPGKGTMLDVGANVGFYSLAASLFFSRVEAFEPCAATYERLQRNICLSSKPHVRAHRMALGSRIGLAEMMAFDSSPGRNHILPSGAVADGHTEIVPIATLDSAVSNLRLADVDFIKIDVEGHERDVLAGGRLTLEQWHPDVFVECHDNDSLRACASLLPSGYVPWDVLAERPCTLERLLAKRDRYLDVLFRSEERPRR